MTTSDRHARTLAETAVRVAQQEGGGRIAHAFRFTTVDDLRHNDPYGAIWLVGGRDGRAPFLGSDRRVTIAPQSFRRNYDEELGSHGPLTPILGLGGEPEPTAMVDDPRVVASAVASTPTAIVGAPDARSAERKGTEPNLDNFTGGIHGT